MTVSEQIVGVRADLRVGREKLGTLRSELEAVRKKDLELNTQKRTLVLRLGELEGLIANIGPLTAGLSVTLSNMKTKLSESEGRISEAEAVIGVRGVARSEIVSPATKPATSYDDLAQEWSELKENEKLGKVPRGTAAKFLQKHRAVLFKEAPASSEQSKAKEETQNWAQNILRAAK